MCTLLWKSCGVLEYFTSVLNEMTNERTLFRAL